MPLWICSVKTTKLKRSHKEFQSGSCPASWGKSIWGSSCFISCIYMWWSYCASLWQNILVTCLTFYNLLPELGLSMCSFCVNVASCSLKEACLRWAGTRGLIYDILLSCYPFCGISAPQVSMFWLNLKLSDSLWYPADTADNKDLVDSWCTQPNIFIVWENILYIKILKGQSH